MTDTDINIAIAEACGWKMVCDEAEKSMWKSREQWATDPNGMTAPKTSIPNYCLDLNAMHEAENTLNQEEITEYLDWLDSHDEMIEWAFVVHATARQRAEAFLRVKGLWRY
jgi:hypothetical protein